MHGGAEDYLRPGMRALDVGSGSGILARAAHLLGAGRVYACDIDNVAVEIAGMAETSRIVSWVRWMRWPRAWRMWWPPISAPKCLIQLAPDLLRVRRAGGVLLARRPGNAARSTR